MHTHIFLFFYFFIFFIFILFFMFLGLGLAQPSAQPSHWPKPVTRLGHTRHAWSKSRVHGPAIELSTDGENEIRQSGENRARDLPGSFAGNLRVIAKDDASAFDFPLTPSAFHVVFLSCVSVSVYFSSFLLLCFQNEPILSLCQFRFLLF